MNEKEQAALPYRILVRGLKLPEDYPTCPNDPMSSPPGGGGISGVAVIAFNSNLTLEAFYGLVRMGEKAFMTQWRLEPVAGERPHMIEAEFPLQIERHHAEWCLSRIPQSPADPVTNDNLMGSYPRG